jgi:hypothetical protein
MIPRVASWAALVVVLGSTIGVTSVAAVDPVTFGTPSASSSFGKNIEFKQPVAISGTPTRVELLITTPGSIGPEIVPLPPGTASGSSTLDYKLDLSDGHVVPNTTFTAQWRVVETTGTWLGPVVTRTYVDDRYDWKTLDGKVVRVHWYNGNQAFGVKALKIGEDAVAATAKLLGVTESAPIDFFIYADQQPFYDALGPGTRENVGGQAHPDIRTLFALIAPDEIDAGWIESVVPHELTHVVFATAIDNPYHEPPHWLNEGLAVYLSDGYDASYKAMVESAAKDGSIIPLDGLAGAFPTTRDRFFLAYGESVSAVDRIVRVNGRDALVKLIRSYHDGVSDDEAFKAALGRDVAGFESDWLAELGAKPPVQHGPQPAPVGPLPAGWSGPRPNPSFEVVGSAAPGAPAPSSPIGATGSTPSLLIPLLVGGAALLAVVIAAVALRRRGRRSVAYARAGRIATDLQQPPHAPAPPSWTSTDWSLPRDVDPADGESPTQPWPAPPAPVDPPTPGPSTPGDSAASPGLDPPNDPPPAPLADR